MDKMLGLKKHDLLSQWCRFPRGKCTCLQGVGYARLHESVEDTWRENHSDDDSSTSSKDNAEELQFFNDTEGFQSVVVERNLCASDLCQLLAMKNRMAKSVHWSIIEYWSDLGIERQLEDHEYVLAAYKDMKNFSYHAKFKFRFRKDFRKYEFFHHPQQFFPYGMLNIETETDKDINKNHPNLSHLQYMVIQEGMCPMIFSHVWIRDERKKVWIKTFMLLRDQKLFISQKIQALAKFMRKPKEQALEMISEDKHLSNEIQVFADIRRYHAYTTLNAKNQFRAPTEWGIVLRPTNTITSTTGKTADTNEEEESVVPCVSFSSFSSSSDQLRCLACDSERVRSCWVIAMRLAKYGKQLRENYRAFRNKQSDSINSKDYNSYSVPNESVRSRVAMDFTGAVGRIVEDPQEATAIAVAEGYSWKRRWRGYARGSTGPGGNQTQPAYVQSIDAGIHMMQPWFHSGLTRDKAAELVAKHGTVDGVFLVRDSRSNPGSYVITYKCGGKVIHAQVNPILDPLRDRPVFSIDNGATKFYDLLQLVEFYQLNAGCLPTRLTHYVTFLLTADNVSTTTGESPHTSQNGTFSLASSN